MVKRSRAVHGLSASQLEALVDECMGDLDQTELGQEIEHSVSNFAPGKIVAGKVLRITGEEVVVDISYKSEGFIPAGEFEATDELRVGDEFQVLLEEIEDESGLVRLSKRKADRITKWKQIMDSFRVGDAVTGKVAKKIKGGLLVDIGVPVFLPTSQIDVRRTADPSEWLGQEIECLIIKIDEDRRNIVVSRRKLLEERRRTMKEALLSSIQVGEVRRGEVKNITAFGAFVDLGGIDGLLHITDMSWGRTQHPSDLLKPGQVVEVKVLHFEPERERISLGLKQLTPNPWSMVEERYPPGSRHFGEVVNIVPYGAFVKLEPGLEGLVHISEMSWTRQISSPHEVVKAGQQVEVIVLDINKEKQEISLGMKQTEGNPWEHVEEKYPTGVIIEGRVRNMTSYGAFVELEGGVDGLLHVSDISWTRKITHPGSVLKKGEKIRAKVLEVDQNRKRIALGLKQLEEDPWISAIPARFAPGDVIAGKITKLTSFGAFVEIDQDLEGLLHISEMAEHKLEKPEEAVQVGQELQLKVVNVDPAERKIGLSLKAMRTAGVKGVPAEPVDLGSFAPKPERGATLAETLREALKEREERKAATQQTGEALPEEASGSETETVAESEPAPEEKTAPEAEPAAGEPPPPVAETETAAPEGGISPGSDPALAVPAAAAAPTEGDTPPEPAPEPENQPVAEACTSPPSEPQAEAFSEGVTGAEPETVGAPAAEPPAEPGMETSGECSAGEGDTPQK